MEEDKYIKFFLDSPFVNETPRAFVVLFLLGLMRLLPIIALTPFLGAKILPRPLKVSMGIVLFIVLLPHILITTTSPPQLDFYLFIYGFKEMLIGTIIGLIATVPFFVAETAGVYIDHQRGGSSLMVQDPHVQNQDSPLGILQNYILIVVYYGLNGHFIFIDSLIRSYSVLPLDVTFSPLFFSAESPFWEIVINIMGEVMRMAIQIASPALLAILMTDTFLGVANRLAMQVMITFLGMPLKSLAGLGVFCFGWYILTDQVTKNLFDWLRQLDEVVGFFGFGLPPPNVPVPF